MDKNKKMIIGILTAAIVLVVAFIVYITCFDSHIEFSSKFKNGITVEYGKKFEHLFAVSEMRGSVPLEIACKALSKSFAKPA